MSVPYAITDTALTVVLDCVPHVIPRTHPNFDKVIEKLTVGANDDEIRDLIDLPKAIEQFMQGNIEIRDRVVYYKGAVLHNQLASYILHFMEKNDPALVKPLVAFLDNVMENPSYRAVQGLFEWVQKSNLPLTNDGHLLAWKIVGPDYRDIHSRRYDNSVGQIVEQDRNLCDEDPDRTCSSGLHFCSYEYIPHYGTAEGNRIMVVKINPRDVVAFPRDYNTSKGRCCRYEVVGEVNRQDVPGFFGDAPIDSRYDPIRFTEGTYYVTAGGYVAEITEIDDDPLRRYPVIGKIMCYLNADNQRVDLRVTWDRNGYFNPDSDNEDEFDLSYPIDSVVPGDVAIQTGQHWLTRYDTVVVVTDQCIRTDSRYGDVAGLSDIVCVWVSNGDSIAGTTAGQGHLRRLIKEV